MSELQFSAFDGLLAKMMDGKLIPPGLKEEPISQEIISRMSRAAKLERTKSIIISEYDVEKGTFDKTLYYPALFLETGGMSGEFKGSGVILAEGKLFTFQICEHEWDHTGANHSRGWHPARCKKCKFDASIDSGD